MANTSNLKLVLKHLSNGTLGENLCIICLQKLEDQYENIFTTICKHDMEYCIADVLRTMCEVTLSDTDNYNVCINCFMMASMAYKFYLLSKRSHEIINFYTNELLTNMEHIELPDETTNNTLCISVPEILTETPIYDFNLHAIAIKTKVEIEERVEVKSERIEQKREIVKEIKKENQQNMDIINEKDNVVVIIQDNGEPLFYHLRPDGILDLLSETEVEKHRKVFNSSMDIVSKEDQPKRKRIREPMSMKPCTRCPVKYRFMSKLKQHMKLEHNISLYICKLCKATTEDEYEYHSHLKTHTNVHQCAECNTVFKKRATIINHLKWHEKMKHIIETSNAHICEICGVILANEDSLRQHNDKQHYKKYTCNYCGRMYKGELSFNRHIKKHEAHIKAVELRSKPENNKNQGEVPPSEKPKPIKRCMCATCGRHFVDERALMWHQRLHTNERPYTCDVCGRGFVTLNRRNQHAMTAHTAPSRRCPLCPALFHLRSMVNTHIRKVHLKAHKRRNRVSKHQNVYWRTEPVPIQELSVALQNDILALQQASKNDLEWSYVETSLPVNMEECS